MWLCAKFAIRGIQIIALVLIQIYYHSDTNDHLIFARWFLAPKIIICVCKIAFESNMKNYHKIYLSNKWLNCFMESKIRICKVYRHESRKTWLIFDSCDGRKIRAKSNHWSYTMNQKKLLLSIFSIFFFRKKLHRNDIRILSVFGLEII